jgi:2-keto-4-pentenoate hydratase/2-oxohepta-3-ene-1,7-dioic acid hydratase in catechol pathway
VVWLGTDEVPRSLNPGDTIEIEITGIGALRNRVVAEA